MPAVASSPQDVDLALSLLGLSRGPLDRCIMSAEALVSNVIFGRHPRNYRGVVAWGETTFHLRDELDNMGVKWKPEGKTELPASIVEDGGSSSMISVLGLDYVPFETGGYQIVVAGGDAKTGSVGGSDPSCANLKGHLMARAVRANTRGTNGGGVRKGSFVGNAMPDEDPQIVMNFDDRPAIENSAPSSTARGTWIFLVRYGADGIYAELSRPHLITRAGRIKDWSHRIVLGRIGSAVPVAISMGTFGPNPDFGDFGMSDELGEEALPGS